MCACVRVFVDVCAWGGCMWCGVVGVRVVWCGGGACGVWCGEVGGACGVVWWGCMGCGVVGVHVVWCGGGACGVVWWEVHVVWCGGGACGVVW